MITLYEIHYDDGGEWSKKCYFYGTTLVEAIEQFKRMYKNFRFIAFDKVVGFYPACDNLALIPITLGNISPFHLR